MAELVLEEFRNYASQQISLDPGLNLFVGRNAQGKTNLLEAIYCLSGFGSPRGPDAAMVRQGAEEALLHAVVERGDRRVTIDMQFRPGRGRKALVNKTNVPSTRSLGDVIVSVFFGPDELSLVKGSPDGRRRFLDDLVVKLRPAQEALRRNYEKVLRQRNALLKQLPKGPLGADDRTSLEVWDEQLVSAGAALAAARLRALGWLIPFASRRYREVAGDGGLSLSYVSSWIEEKTTTEVLGAPDSIDVRELEEALRRKIEQRRIAELERRLTLVGPGRDDVRVELLAGETLLDARLYASQGDQRTAALALKLGEHDLLSDALGDTPVLLLDDVFSELDPRRKGWLREAVRTTGQTLLSSAETDTWEAVEPDAIFRVDSGVAVRGGS